MIRKTINFVMSAVCFVSKNRQIRPEAKDKIKINLGAGLSVCPGWINIDNSLNSLVSSCPKIIHRLLYRISGARENYSFQEYHSILKEHSFVCHNLVCGIPLRDNCADFVYCSHFLEHISLGQGTDFLRGIYRILKNGGRLRLVVPDLAYAIKLYTKGQKEEALKQFYEGWENGNEFARHKYMYDYEILAKRLNNAGFGNITQYEYRRGKTPDIELLDNRPESSLFVEAVKI